MDKGVFKENHLCFLSLFWQYSFFRFGLLGESLGNGKFPWIRNQKAWPTQLPLSKHDNNSQLLFDPNHEGEYRVVGWIMLLVKLTLSLARHLKQNFFSWVPKIQNNPKLEPPIFASAGEGGGRGEETHESGFLFFFSCAVICSMLKG